MSKSYEYQEFEDRLASARETKNLEQRLEKVRQTLLTDATQLLVDHVDMIDRLTTELERTFGRDFGLRQMVALGKASVEDMKAFV